MDRKRRIGVYLGARQVLDNPAYVPTLRDHIGLNLAVIEYSGQVSPRLAARTPFDGLPLSDGCLHDLVCRHLDGGPVDPREFDQVRRQVGPSVTAGGDDDAFRQALAALRRAGMEVWICPGAWTLRRLMFCPSHPGTNAWLAGLYAELATRYEVDGLDVTHARFPMASFPRGLFACTCGRCVAAAVALGFDMARLVRALTAARDRLAAVDVGRLRILADAPGGLGDLWQSVGTDVDLTGWLAFRARLLESRLQGFRAAVRAAAGPQFVFGTDTHPASLSMLVGHDYARWDRYSDFASPLVSHIAAFVCDTFRVWAQYLIDGQPSLGEAAALRLVYRFTGYAGLGLPESFAGFAPDRPERLASVIPVADLVLCDLRKARALLPADMPSYPIIHGTGWPRAAIDRIVSEAEAMGHDGIVWQGTDELVRFALK